MPERTNVYLRADGNNNIGLGHIFRLLALAEILKGHFNCIFISGKVSPSVANSIETSVKLIVIDFESEQEELTYLTSIVKANDILVTDGYQFREKFQERILSVGIKLIMIDDHADMDYSAHAVINHGGQFKNYNMISGGKAFLGFDYLLLREEFLQQASLQNLNTQTSDLLICLGGADPLNITLKVLKAALACPGVSQIDVVTGSAYNGMDELIDLFDSFTKGTIRHHKNISANKMTSLIGSNRLTICPASTIAMEACCIGTGLLCGTYVENQLGLYNQLLKNECIYPLGDLIDISAEELEEAINSNLDLSKISRLIQNQRKLIDGRSGERLIAVFKDIETTC